MQLLHPVPKEHLLKGYASSNDRLSSLGQTFLWSCSMWEIRIAGIKSKMREYLFEAIGGVFRSRT